MRSPSQPARSVWSHGQDTLFQYEQYLHSGAACRIYRCSRETPPYIDKPDEPSDRRSAQYAPGPAGPALLQQRSAGAAEPSGLPTAGLRRAYGAWTAERSRCQDRTAPAVRPAAEPAPADQNIEIAGVLAGQTHRDCCLPGGKKRSWHVPTVLRAAASPIRYLSRQPVPLH
ncbi:hypothetical protein D3C75_829210 [compost metagenome]